ncbi:MAG TPA: response regulator transcription factor [Pirellulales bacterium]|nr:response regulator transcription factor [Pirellulales bacterium]
MTLTSKRKNATRPIQILIVDDHPLVREGLATRISSQEGFEVCGEAADLETALELARTTKPDLVIVDISLKSGDGIDLMKRIRATDGHAKMLVATMYDESLYAERAVRAGATGYINKQEMPEKIIEAIREVLSGRLYLSPQMTRHIVRLASGATNADPSPIARLSDRELEVFRSIGQGRTTRRIATELGLSVRTIETHRENIKGKLDARNSAELGRIAVQWVLENG